MRTAVQEKSAEIPKGDLSGTAGLRCALLTQVRSLKRFFAVNQNVMHAKEPRLRTAWRSIALLQFPFSRYIRQISGRDSAARQQDRSSRGSVGICRASRLSCVLRARSAELAAFTPSKIRVKQSFIQMGSGLHPGRRRELCHAIDILFHSPMPSPIRRSGRE